MKHQCPHRGESSRGGGQQALLSEAVTLADKVAGESDHAFFVKAAQEINLETDSVILYTGDNKEDFSTLCKESINLSLLDTGCTGNVCGLEWLETVIASFSDEMKKSIKTEEGKKRFKFGGDEILKSLKRVTLLVTLAGHICKITTDVVPSSIPLLLSVNSMKQLELMWDLKNDRARIL